MSVKIIRRTGWMGMLGAITIKIDGKKVERIKSEEELEVTLAINKRLVMEIKLKSFAQTSLV